MFFVTNNSTKTQDDYAKRFNDIGYKAKPVRWIKKLIFSRNFSDLLGANDLYGMVNCSTFKIKKF